MAAKQAVGRNGFAEARRVKAELTRPEVSFGLAGGGRSPGDPTKGDPPCRHSAQRMIEAMILAGLAEGTQARLRPGGLAAGHVLPALAGPAQRGGGPGLPAGPAPARGGARHLRDRPRRPAVLLPPNARPGLGSVRGKKGSPCRGRSGCLNALTEDQVRRLLGGVRNPVHRTCLAVMYACGLRISEAITLEVTRHRPGPPGAAHHRQGQQGAAGAAAPAHARRRSSSVWRTHHNRRWLFPNRRGDAPLNERVLSR